MLTFVDGRGAGITYLWREAAERVGHGGNLSPTRSPSKESCPGEGSRKARHGDRDAAGQAMTVEGLLASHTRR